MKALTSNMKILSCSILFLAAGKLNYNRALTHTTIDFADNEAQIIAVYLRFSADYG